MNTLFGGLAEGRPGNIPTARSRAAERGRQDFKRQSYKPPHKISSQALISATSTGTVYSLKLHQLKASPEMGVNRRGVGAEGTRKGPPKAPAVF